MPFTNYAEVAAYGEFIEYVTSIGYMPPWSPDETYSHFVGENVLTPSQLATLSDWVEAGKPEGDPADNPGLPDFPDGSQIGPTIPACLIFPMAVKLGLRTMYWAWPNHIPTQGT